MYKQSFCMNERVRVSESEMETEDVVDGYHSYVRATSTKFLFSKAIIKFHSKILLTALAGTISLRWSIASVAMILYNYVISRVCSVAWTHVASAGIYLIPLHTDCD